jgi:hypothetical protein
MKILFYSRNPKKKSPHVEDNMTEFSSDDQTINEMIGEQFLYIECLRTCFTFESVFITTFCILQLNLG